MEDNISNTGFKNYKFKELKVYSSTEYLDENKKKYRQVFAVSYTHLRAHETVLDIVCRLLLEKKNQPTPQLLT